MTGPVRGKRRKSAQSYPSSGMDRAASRTTVPPILLTQNRLPHRRWRGRSAVPDPARSMPGDAPVFRESGGDDGTSAAYRRASGRTFMERRSSRNRVHQGGARIGADGSGGAAKGGMTDKGERRRRVSSPSFAIITESRWRGRFERFRREGSKAR